MLWMHVHTSRGGEEERRRVTPSALRSPNPNPSPSPITNSLAFSPSSVFSLWPFLLRTLSASYRRFLPRVLQPNPIVPGYTEEMHCVTWG